jgi:hypothetical protein
MHDPAGDAAMWEGAVRGIGCVVFMAVSLFVVAVVFRYAERLKRRPIIEPRKER